MRKKKKKQFVSHRFKRNPLSSSRLLLYYFFIYSFGTLVRWKKPFIGWFELDDFVRMWILLNIAIFFLLALWLACMIINMIWMNFTAIKWHLSKGQFFLSAKMNCEKTKPKQPLREQRELFFDHFELSFKVMSINCQLCHWQWCRDKFILFFFFYSK